jgi:hypothetical protein
MDRGLLRAGGFAIVGALSYLFVVGRIEPLLVEAMQHSSHVQ